MSWAVMTQGSVVYELGHLGITIQHLAITLCTQYTGRIPGHITTCVTSLPWCISV